MSGAKAKDSRSISFCSEKAGTPTLCPVVPAPIWILGKKYVNIPSEKYIYVHKYVYICVFTYLCKMDEHRSYAGLS